MCDDEDNFRHDHLDSMWPSVKFDDAISEYYMTISDQGDGISIRQSIAFCPSCGKKLPPSHFDEWIEELGKLGINPLDDVIPDQFKTSEWRKRMVDNGD